MASIGNIFDTPPQKNKHGKLLGSTNKIKKKPLQQNCQCLRLLHRMYPVDCRPIFVVFVAIIIAIVVAFVVVFVIAFVAVCSITDKEETPFNR